MMGFAKYKGLKGCRLLQLVLFLLTAVLFLTPEVGLAQTLSGRGVDARAIANQQQSCRVPALNLQQRIIVLRQGIEDILACNATGGLFQSDGSCVLAVSPDHRFQDPAPAEPEDRSGLSFSDTGGNFSIYGIIGGKDGDDITCQRGPGDCTPRTEQQTENCPDGTVIVTHTRAFICPEGILTDWEPTGATCDNPPGDTCFYNGVPYDEGEQFTLFSNNNVVCGEDFCDAQVFTCSGGTISPNPNNFPGYTFTNEGMCIEENNCGNGGGNPCTFGGETYEDGEGFTLFKSAGEVCDTCADRQFTCDDGVISPNPNSFPNFIHTTLNACLDTNPCPPTNDCQLPADQGGVLLHGESRILFGERGCTGPCPQRTITCVDGQLSANYNASLTATCVPINPNTHLTCYCTLENVNWLHGTTRWFTGPGDGRLMLCCEPHPQNYFVEVNETVPGAGGGTDQHCF